MSEFIISVANSAQLLCCQFHFNQVKFYCCDMSRNVKHNRNISKCCTGRDDLQRLMTSQVTTFHLMMWYKAMVTRNYILIQSLISLLKNHGQKSRTFEPTHSVAAASRVCPFNPSLPYSLPRVSYLFLSYPIL
jgi:uncharacterized protein YpmS